MHESFLHFIWQRQYFNRSALQTSDLEPIEVLSPGVLNCNQGPDFLDARIRIGATCWCGPVELHIRSSDWQRHGHHGDPHYGNVILHVVWEHDADSPRGIPVLELSGRIPRVMEDTYLGWMRNLSRIPCERELVRQGLRPSAGWLRKLLTERLERRADEIEARIAGASGDRETVFWWQLARCFGHRVNADAFEEMARSLPLSLIGRHRSAVQQIEALLLGQCGLLEVKPLDPYVALLQREYRFLKHKCGLHPVRTPVKYLRMRPHNFPTVRLAQLAMLLHRQDRIFPMMMDLTDLHEVFRILTVTANDFWHYHYRLERPSAFLEKTLGREMVGNILINAVLPFRYLQARQRADAEGRDRVMEWLSQLEPEANVAVRVFLDGRQRAASAAETQALLEQEREYCARRRCLECDVGQRLMSAPGTSGLQPEPCQSRNSSALDLGRNRSSHLKPVSSLLSDGI